MRHIPLFVSSLLVATALTPVASAQKTVVVRDRIEQLPAISICMDGATHRTIVTNLRLRPTKMSGSLAKFDGMAVEVIGSSGQITCPFVDVASITALADDQSTRIVPLKAVLRVDFYGTSSTNAPFMLFVGAKVLNAPIMLPGIQGPIHLDPTMMVFVGIFPPLGTQKPYTTLSTPVHPSLIGVDFFDQAVALGTGSHRMTNVDSFRF